MKDNIPLRKKRKPRSLWRFFVNWKFIGVLALLGVTLWFSPSPDIEKPILVTQRISMDPASGLKTETAISLFVADKNHTGLSRLEKMIDTGETVEEKIYGALKALFDEEAASSSLFPEEMVVREVFVYDTTAVVSLDGDFRRKFKGGVWTELLAVYSLVNTVSENFGEINGIRILIDDKETDFFVDHVDITRAFESDFSFVLEEKATEETEEVENNT